MAKKETDAARELAKAAGKLLKATKVLEFATVQMNDAAEKLRVAFETVAEIQYKNLN